VSSKKIILPIHAKLPFEHLSIIQKNEKTFLEKFVVNLLKKKKIVKSIQPSHNSFYWPRLNADVDGLINWTWQADEIISFIRAFSKPYNGAYSFLKGNKIRIFNAYKIKTSQKFHSFQSGIIFRYYKNFFYVAVKEYALKILSSDIYGLNKDHSYYLGKRFLDE
jgi:methionyl-tRNA formyltransferase